MWKQFGKSLVCRKFPQCADVSKTCPRHYGTKVIKDIMKLYERGVFTAVCPEMSEPYVSKLLSSPQTIYCGFDPTANSLHVGNLLAIIGLIHCQRAGHSPLALVGGATAHIGDPSGKSEDRPKIDAETIENNILGITENLERIFTNHEVGGATAHIGDPSGKSEDRPKIDAETIENNILGITENLERIFINHEVYLWKNDSNLKSLRVVNNMSWYSDQNVISFLSDVGRHFRMGHMLSKHSVKSRLKSSDGMCFTEFTYQIFQSHDWLHLYKHYDCKLQIGGNDQIGNITAGIEYIHKVLKKDVYGLTIPLLTTSSGLKFGKTAKNAIWLDPDRTSPYALYQYFMNTSDRDVEQYLNLLTFIPDTDIAEVMRNHKEVPEKRVPQKLLAEKLVILVHGESGLNQAKRWTKAFFSNDPHTLLELSEDEIRSIFSSTSTLEILYDPAFTVCDLAMKIGSKSFRTQADAVRIIQSGGFHINHQKVTQPDIVLLAGQHILPNDLSLIRVGKKNYHVVKWVYS